MRKEYVGAALLSNSLLDCASRPIFESAICQPFQTGCQMQTDLTESIQAIPGHIPIKLEVMLMMTKERNGVDDEALQGLVLQERIGLHEVFDK